MSIFDKFRNKSELPQKIRHTDSVSGIPFSAYNGREPYMFISYAHVDSPVVFELITEYYDLGYNVWYDEGIEPGIEWPEEIGRALSGSSLFVVFISRASINSANVRNEINLAIKRHIPFIAVYIEETELTVGLDLQIGARQAIMWYKMDKESYRRKYTYSFDAVLKSGHKRKAVPEASQAKTKSETKPKAEPDQQAEPEPLQVLQTEKPQAEPTTDQKTIDFLKNMVIDDCNWISNKLTRYLGTDKELTIPARASFIFSNAFRNNDTIEKIIVPSYVSNIDIAAFDNCANLELVVVEGGYVTIGRPVASRCPKLVFQCHRGSQTHNNLKQAFPGDIIFFDGEDFEIEHGLLHKYLGKKSEVSLPEEVELIGGFAFNNCPELESVIFTNDSGAIFENAFISCPRLRNITIGKNFSSIAKNAFIGCPNVRFSYYTGKRPDRFNELFPDPSIAFEIV